MGRLATGLLRGAWMRMRAQSVHTRARSFLLRHTHALVSPPSRTHLGEVLFEVVHRVLQREREREREREGGREGGKENNDNNKKKNEK